MSTADRVNSVPANNHNNDNNNSSNNINSNRNNITCNHYNNNSNNDSNNNFDYINTNYIKLINNFEINAISAKACLQVQNRKLEYRQHVMEKEVGDMQEAFDGALAVLRREKLHLEADVKAAQIKRLTYQQELQLLKVGYCGIQGSTNVLDEKGSRSGG